MSTETEGKELFFRHRKWLREDKEQVGIGHMKISASPTLTKGNDYNNYRNISSVLHWK